MPFKHTCKTCGLEITYVLVDTLKPYFYFKDGYIRGECKSCECKKHSKKYKEGKYNYYKRTKLGYDKDYNFGNQPKDKD